MFSILVDLIKHEWGPVFRLSWQEEHWKIVLYLELLWKHWEWQHSRQYYSALQCTDSLCSDQTSYYEYFLWFSRFKGNICVEQLKYLEILLRDGTLQIDIRVWSELNVTPDISVAKISDIPSPSECHIQ